jgi:uncharacterized membrane protein
MRTRFRLTLLLLVFIAIFLRLYHLDVQSLWYDEGVTARVSQLGIQELARWTANDIQPPLYYLLMSGWLRLFGPWAGNIAYLMRFLSAAFGVMLVPLLGILARKLWNDCAGLLTAFVVAVSPLMVYYSQEARMYAMLIFLVTLAAWWVVVLLDRSSYKGSKTQPGDEKWRLIYLALYALTGLAAMYTHYFAGFALLALVLYWGHVWLRESRNKRALAGFALANVVILLGYLPWLPAMLRRFQIDSSYWSGTLKMGEALMHTVNNFTVGATELFYEDAARAWWPWFGLAVIIWIVALIMTKRRGSQRPLALILHWLLIPPVLILFLAYRTPKFNPRYLLISWPAWALLIGGGAAALWQPDRWLQNRPTWLRWAARIAAIATLLLVITTSALGLDNWYNDPNFAKSAWREAIGYMFEHRQPDEAALIVSGHAYPVFDAYLPPDAEPPWFVPRYHLPDIEILNVNEVLGWEESARALNADLADYGGVWLFLWQDEVVDPAHVVTIQLGRYAQEQSVPPFAFLGLRHYRLPPDFHVPEQPPITLPGAQLGPGLELAGLEPAPGGLWLYWRANQPDLPDIKIALTLEKDGQQLVSLDQRPAGYDFPTTHWNAGDIYPVWLPVDGSPDGATLSITAYEADTGDLLGEFETTLP